VCFPNILDRKTPVAQVLEVGKSKTVTFARVPLQQAAVLNSATVLHSQQEEYLLQTASFTKWSLENLKLGKERISENKHTVHCHELQIC
jgi:hypothetical protein